MSYDPNADVAASERFQSYRRGFRDRMLAREAYVRHTTRPDLTAAYLAGYEEAAPIYNAAMKAARERYGYVPSMIRGKVSP